MSTVALLHLPLRLIFRQIPINFINVRSTYASKIYGYLTKNYLTKSGTREQQWTFRRGSIFGYTLAEILFEKVKLELAKD